MVFADLKSATLESKFFKTKKKQGLKSDIDVISVSSPSLISQYAEAFATERTSMEASWMHRQNLRPQ